MSRAMQVKFTAAALSYRFDGRLNGDTMSGTVDMGEYLGAKWTAKRHTFPVG